jgi:hypothetical protein
MLPPLNRYTVISRTDVAPPNNVGIQRTAFVNSVVILPSATTFVVWFGRMELTRTTHVCCWVVRHTLAWDHYVKRKIFYLK